MFITTMRSTNHGEATEHLHENSAYHAYAVLNAVVNDPEYSIGVIQYNVLPSLMRARVDDCPGKTIGEVLTPDELHTLAFCALMNSREENHRVLPLPWQRKKEYPQ